MPIVRYDPDIPTESCSGHISRSWRPSTAKWNSTSPVGCGGLVEVVGPRGVDLAPCHSTNGRIGDGWRDAYVPRRRSMMKFLLFIWHDEAAWDRAPRAEQERAFRVHAQLNDELTAQGKLVETRRLRPGTEATTVRVQNGELVTTDGPYAEAKEVIGGYYLIDCTSREEAIGWARKLPGVSLRGVEVRGVWDAEPT